MFFFFSLFQAPRAWSRVESGAGWSLEQGGVLFYKIACNNVHRLTATHCAI